MTRAAIQNRTERQRTALRRALSAASVTLFLFAIYQALPRSTSCPQPANPKPGVGYACDPSGPTYHHPVFWLLVAAGAVVAFIVARRSLREDAV